MPANAAAVIKKHRVREVPPDPAAGAPAARGGRAPAGQPQVRLDHQDADHAVLEVRCPCGNVIRVECRWEVPATVGQPVSPGPADPPQPNKEATQ